MFNFPDEFIPLPLQEAVSELEQKKLFAAELAIGKMPFEAALTLFPNDANKAATVSQLWANDPKVLREKNLRIESLKNEKTFLDKSELADIALDIAQEGGKDRIAALKLYAEIAGYTGKSNVEELAKTITDNSMTIVFKSSREEIKEPKIIDHSSLEIPSNDEMPKTNDMTIKFIRKVG